MWKCVECRDQGYWPNWRKLGPLGQPDVPLLDVHGRHFRVDGRAYGYVVCDCAAGRRKRAALRRGIAEANEGVRFGQLAVPEAFGLRRKERA